MTRRRIGCILMVIGLVIFMLLMTVIILRDVHMWQNNTDGFARKYASCFDLIYSREKGAILIAAAAGFIPAIVGFTLYRDDAHK